MYDFLDGQVAQRSGARLVLDVGGVGYELLVPLGSSFPAHGRTRIHVHLIVREDAHLLYGFQDRETRDLFRLLLAVRGVGGAMALAILSGLPREPLLEAVANGDMPTLTRIRGVGRKTAEQILLDMREKAQTLRSQQLASNGAPQGLAGGRAAQLEDAIAALVSIGYSEKEARKSVERAAEKVAHEDLGELVRAALSS